MDLPFGSVGVEKGHQKDSNKKQQTKGKQWLEQQYVLVTSTIKNNHFLFVLIIFFWNKYED